MPDRAWYYASGGQQRGPVKTAELKRLAAAGDLRPTDLVWTDNMANWAAASTVKGLFAEREAAVSSPPTATTSLAAASPPEVTADNPVVAEVGEPRPEIPLVALAPREAWAALQKLVVDPWGLLGTIYEQLGPKRATIVGGAFVATFFLCCALAMVFQQAVGLPGVSVLASSEAIAVIKALIVLIGYVAALIGTVSALRMLGKTGALMAADVFVAGAALLPLGAYVVISAMLNPLSAVVQWIISVLFIFAAVTSVLMLYNGLKQPVRLSDRLSALGVPIVLAAAMTAAQLLQWLLATLPV